MSKQQAVDADPKSIQQINFTGNLENERNVNTTMFFIIEELFSLDFSQGTVKVLWIYFASTWYQYKITLCNTLNIKLSNSELHKLKSEIKNGT